MGHHVCHLFSVFSRSRLTSTRNLLESFIARYLLINQVRYKIHIYYKTNVSIISIQIYIYCRYIPESASWLITQGKLEQASDTLFMISQTNGCKLSTSDITDMLNQMCVPLQNTDQEEEGECSKDKDKQEEAEKLTSVFKYPIVRLQIATCMFTWWVHVHMLSLYWIERSQNYSRRAIEQKIVQIFNWYIFNFFQVMRQEVTAYQTKLRQLELRQQHLINDNIELKVKNAITRLKFHAISS